MAKDTLQDLSKKRTFVFDQNHRMTYDELNSSALLRIAEALEIQSKNSNVIAQNTVDLIKDRDWYKARCQRLEAENKRLIKSNSALRGVVTRTKNKVQEVS